MKFDDDLRRIREDLRDVSRQTFGKLHRLESVAVIGAQEPPIWSRRLARSLDIGENQAAAELAFLEQLEALQRFPAEHDRRKIFQPLPHPIWGFSRDLLERTIQGTEAGDRGIDEYWAAVLDGVGPMPIPR